jgi:hypothetical protein
MVNQIKPKHTETKPQHTEAHHEHPHAAPKTKEQQIEHARAQLMKTVKELGGDGKAIQALVTSGLNLNNLADSTKGLKVGDAIKAVHKGKVDPDKLNQLRNELSLLQVLGDPQLLQAEGESHAQIQAQQQAGPSPPAAGPVAAPRSMSTRVRRQAPTARPVPPWHRTRPPWWPISRPWAPPRQRST